MEPFKVLLFLPATVCLYWIVTYYFVARRTSFFWIFVVLSTNLMLFFTSDALYAMPGAASETLVVSHFVTLLTGPCVLPLIWLYMDKLRFRKHLRPVQFIWMLAPVALLFASISVTEALGRDVVASFLNDIYTNGPQAASLYRKTLLWHYYIWSTVLFRILVSLELALGAVYIILLVVKGDVRLSHLWAFLRKGEPISVVELQVYNLILPGIFVLSKVLVIKSFLAVNPWIAVAQALLVTIGFFLFAMGSLYGEKDRITIVQCTHIMFYNYNKAIKGPMMGIMLEELISDAPPETLAHLRERLNVLAPVADPNQAGVSSVREKMMSSVVGTWDDSLVSRFQALMVNEKLFLLPSLGLGDIAERLHTNKTYVSKLVNNTYGLSFPELLNTLRIDYAQRYLQDHPDAKQSEVANACGFLSASSFNNIFKKITGMTPKVWLVSSGK